MRLTALVQSLDHVCCRYRLAAYRSFLEKAGHRLEIVPCPRSVLGWWQLCRDLTHTEAVIVQRKLLHAWQLYLLRQNARFLIFDFDDAVFLRDSYAVKGLHDRRRRRRFAAMIQAADAVSAGNDFLRERACVWTSDARVDVIPTCVDHELYPPAEHCRAGAGVELVWIGSSSTLRGLEIIQPLLEHIGRSCPGVCLKMICDRFLSLRHLPVRESFWSEAGETFDLAAGDIGISWVPADDWSRGKCGLKVLQYLAAGLPVVANPVGIQSTLVRPGVTGFLAETQEQWLEAIDRLARDPGLRRRMGQAGRRLVEVEYSVQKGAQQWLNLLEKVQNERRGARRSA